MENPQKMYLRDKRHILSFLIIARYILENVDTSLMVPIVKNNFMYDNHRIYYNAVQRILSEFEAAKICTVHVRPSKRSVPKSKRPKNAYKHPTLLKNINVEALSNEYLFYSTLYAEKGRHSTTVAKKLHAYINS